MTNLTKRTLRGRVVAPLNALSLKYLAFLTLAITGFFFCFTSTASAQVDSDATPIFFTKFDGSLSDIYNDMDPQGSVPMQVQSDGRVAAYFDGTLNVLEYDTTNYFGKISGNDANFTVVTRLKFAQTGGSSNYQFPIAMRDSSGSNYYWVLSRCLSCASERFPERLTFTDYPNGTATGSFYDMGTSSNQTFITYAVVYNEGSIKTYANGVLVSESVGAVIPTGNQIPLRIGGAGHSASQFAGWVDYIAIYEGSLNDSEIEGFNTYDAPDLDLSNTWTTEIAESEDMEKFVPDGDYEVGDFIDRENRIYAGPEGNLEYHIYLTYGEPGPLAIYTNTWSGSVTGSRDRARGMRDNHGFVGVAMNTRGMGGSQGSNDAFGYDCKDVKYIIDYVEEYYRDFYDSSQGVHILGASGGGGRALVCSGRYPDLFTSVYATASVANLTTWYSTATVENDRTLMRLRTGVNKGLTYHPPGSPSVSGSIENLEVYQARNASLIGAHNTLSRVYITHGDADTRVALGQSEDYYNYHNSTGKNNEMRFDICEGVDHTVCDLEGGWQWLADRKGLLNLPSSGDFLIGGWVETKKFKIEFLDDVGYMGTVSYELGSNDQFQFIVDTETYEGPTEIVVKDIDNDLDIFDNDILIAKLSNGVLSNTDNSYNFDYNQETKVLSFVLPHMSKHTILGISPDITNSEEVGRNPSRSGGTTLSARIANLEAMGKLDEANALRNQFNESPSISIDDTLSAVRALLDNPLPIDHANHTKTRELLSLLLELMKALAQLLLLTATTTADTTTE